MNELRELTINDCQQARELSDAEGWNQTDKDWQLLVTAPGNVSLAFTSGAKLIATATAMIYGKEMAWIGMVLVHREYRGKGISKLLIDALLGKLKSIRSVKLDATPAGKPVYEKFGFKSEWLIYRMTTDSFAPNSRHSVSNSSINQVVVGEISEIIACDQQAIGFNRKALIEFLTTEYPQEAYILRKHGKIKGFALGREGTRYHNTGPLIANTTEDAKSLLVSAFANHSGKPVVADVPEDKTEIIQWLGNAGFKIQRQFIRMRLGGESLFSISEKYFLIAGPEFG